MHFLHRHCLLALFKILNVLNQVVAMLRFADKKAVNLLGSPKYSYIFTCKGGYASFGNAGHLLGLLLS